jgi:hypothetical protein
MAKLEHTHLYQVARMSLRKNNPQLPLESEEI